MRAQTILVMGEVALAAALLVSAGLLIESLYRLHQEKLGFNAEGLVTMETPLEPVHRRSGAVLWDYERNILERLQALPGIVSVASVNALPLTGWNNLPTQHVGYPEQSIGGMEYRAVTTDYFRAMGIPLLKGREFAASDARSALQAAIISESVAREWWPSGNPLGEQLIVGRYKDHEFPEIKELPREIVGVVGDVKAAELGLPASPTVYVPAPQVGDGIASGMDVAWVVKTQGTSGLANSVRQAVGQVDPEQRITNLRMMDEVVSAAAARPRFDSLLMAAFASLALVLTSIGIYGLLSYQVNQRRHEIGIRMALGARPGDVLQLIVWQGVKVISMGIAAGIAGALALARLMANLLYGVKPSDPRIFIGVAALLSVVGFAASYFPARRATRVDPLVALRYE